MGMHQQQGSNATSCGSRPAVIKLALTCTSASIAEAITYPLDSIKTRLQLQRVPHGHTSSAPSTAPSTYAPLAAGAPASSGVKRGALALSMHVLRTEGLVGMYAGLQPAILRHVFYSGSRITIYEQLRKAWSLQPTTFGDSHLGSKPGDGMGMLGKGPESAFSLRAANATDRSHPPATTTPAAANTVGLGPKMLMGLTAGALGQMVAMPADLLKIRLLADSREVAMGLRPARQYKGTFHAMSTILDKEGVRGLWRGTAPAVQRAALVNLGELSTYDHAKHQILSSGWVREEGPAAHAGASVLSGLVATILSCPADVIKSRMMSQGRSSSAAAAAAAVIAEEGVSTADGKGLGRGTAEPTTTMTTGRDQHQQPHHRHRHYRGAVDCLVQSVRQEGFMVLYKGFFPTWLRLGPWQMIFWVSYEGLRERTGLETF